MLTILKGKKSTGKFSVLHIYPLYNYTTVDKHKIRRSTKVKLFLYNKQRFNLCMFRLKSSSLSFIRMIATAKNVVVIEQKNNLQRKSCYANSSNVSIKKLSFTELFNVNPK